MGEPKMPRTRSDRWIVASSETSTLPLSRSVARRRNAGDERHRAACTSVFATRHGDPAQPAARAQSSADRAVARIHGRFNQRLDQLGPAARVDLVAPRPHLPSAGAVAALAAGVIAVAYMAIETTHYFSPPAERSSRRRSRACRVSSRRRVDREFGVRRIRADGNARVAGSADGWTVAAAIRESGFSRRGRRPDKADDETRTQVGDTPLFCFCAGARDRILVGMSPARRREGASCCDQGRIVRAGLLSPR